MTVNVAATNDGPTISAGETAQLVESTATNPGTSGSVAILTLTGGEGSVFYDIEELFGAGWVDNSNGNFIRVGAYGTAALNTNANTLSYLLDNAKADHLGDQALVTDSFTIPVTDGSGATASADVVFTIEGNNDTPRVATSAEFSFENELSGWETIGSVSQILGGTDGDHAAQLASGATSVGEIETFLQLEPGALAQINTGPPDSNTNPTVGSAMSNEVVAAAQQTLTFDWRFLTDDYFPFGDFGFITISDTATKLSDVFVVGDFGDSGWQSFSWIAPTAGTYVIGFGVMDAGDSAVSSFLQIDNINSGDGAIPDQTTPGDEPWTFQIPTGVFADVDSSLTFNATLANGEPLPSWLTFNAATLTFSGSPPQGSNGPIDLKITANDGEFSVSDVFTLNISGITGNAAPVLTGDLAATVSEGGSVVIGASDLGYSDPDDVDSGITFTVSSPVNGRFGSAASR